MLLILKNRADEEMNDDIKRYEIIQKQLSEINSRAYNRRFFAIFMVTTIFTAGLFAGGILNYRITLSHIDDLQEQICSLQGQSEDLEFQNITYIYNDTSLSQNFERISDSIVVIHGYVPLYSFFGLQYTETQGSGFVYNFKDRMVIITNYHVVYNAVNITIRFSNGNTYPAMLLGSDGYADLAVLSVDSPNTELKPLSIASSSTLNVGDPVIAIGSPFGLGGSMTSGIVSQLGRTIKESLAGDFPIANIIQISAPINPGNSGGPLFNYDSKVVGITTAIIADSEGVGFAIPSNTILREIESLVNTGSYDQHSWLGVSGADMTYEIADEMNVDITYGWLISQVVHGGSADKAGLRGGTQRVQIAGRSVIVNGDIIIAIDGARIINGDDLMTYIEEHTLPHQIINVTIVRNNQMLGLLVELEKRPSLS